MSLFFRETAIFQVLHHTMLEVDKTKVWPANLKIKRSFKVRGKQVYLRSMEIAT